MHIGKEPSLFDVLQVPHVKGLKRGGQRLCQTSLAIYWLCLCHTFTICLSFKHTHSHTHTKDTSKCGQEEPGTCFTT